MSEVQPQDEFSVLHGTTCKELKLEETALRNQASTMPVSPIVPALLATLVNVLSLVSPESKVDLETIFRNGPQAMELIGAKQFVLDNLLESLGGDTPPAGVNVFEGAAFFKSPGNEDARRRPVGRRHG